VQEVIDIAQSVADSRLGVYSEETPRHNEISDVRADITRARSELGWEPHVSLRNGIESMFALGQG
jgi:nucleoside-diphosphate-sugar epimerase